MTSTAATVKVQVIPAKGTASGTYSGSILDAAGGNSLVEPVMVYVVGDCPPGPITFGARIASGQLWHSPKAASAA